MTAKVLSQGTKDRLVAGVCDGLGRYLGIDPVIIRLFFVLGIWSSFSVLLYPLLRLRTA